jgi:predicted ATPase
LRIDGEYVFRLSALDVPPAKPDLARDFRDYGAVRLFIRRAQAADAAFEPLDSTLATIGTICRRLDGIPLAIEFAAARVAALGVHEVAARLDDRFALLTAGRRTALPRHQTLRATLDWSYGLLTESEQHCLRNLAVFPAGFTLDAAASVMGTAGRTLSRHLDDISNLVAKSLVTPDGSTPADRWRLLETVHAYAQGKLRDAGEAADASRRHAAFYRDLVVTAAPASALEPTTGGLAICAREIDNVRAAIDWAFSAEGDAGLGIVLTAEYMPVWLHLSLMGECRERTERALACPPPTASASRRTSMLLNIGLAYALLYTGGAAEKTRAALAVALKGAQESDDIVAQNYVLWALWACHANGGEIRNAQRVVGQYSRLAIRSGSPARRLVAERLIGATMHYRGNQPRARFYLQGVLDDQHRIIDGPHAVWFRYDIRVMAQASLARVLCLQGLTDQAKEMAAASRAGAHRADHPLMLCHSLAEAACSVALMTTDLDAAAESVEEHGALHGGCAADSARRL